MSLKNKEQNKWNKADEDLQLYDTCYLLKSLTAFCISSVSLCRILNLLLVSQHIIIKIFVY